MRCLDGQFYLFAQAILEIGQNGINHVDDKILGLLLAEAGEPGRIRNGVDFLLLQGEGRGPGCAG